MRAGCFGSEKARLAIKKATPAEWWSIIAREYAPNLTRLAMRILSQQSHRLIVNEIGRLFHLFILKLEIDSQRKD